MATTEKQLKSINGSSKRKRFLPHNKPVKKKGSYPLRPGIKGFFITCDGGREHQASLEAINVIDSFFEELVQGPETNYQHTEIGNKLLNKKIKFSYSDNSEDDEDGDDDIEKSEENIQKRPEREDNPTSIGDVNHEISHDEKLGDHKEEEKSLEGQAREDKDKDNEANMKNHEDEKTDIVVPPNKKQHVEVDPVKAPNLAAAKMEEKSIDKLIEAELAELGDKSKRRFSKIASGCNGVVIVQMRKRDGDPSPKDIVQYMMTSLASTRKHVSRFMLRVLPIELTCYASEEEITRAIKPLIAQYFPQETRNQHKFAVLYDARANTGIDRMKIINAVAKSVPSPHKVDLNNPDINIVVQVVKTVCMIGVVEKYKELAKYNLRQLASPKP